MNYITLYQLQSLVENAIKHSLESSYWVVAEISELKVNSSGHCYLELVEKNEASFQPKAKARAVIWASKFTAINDYFKQATNTPLKNGLKVLVCVKINFHAIYGLSYVIENIDPTYTLGDIEKQRQQTIAQLKKDGVFDMNKEFDLEVVIQRIAVISSSNAAGYTDFIKELENNQFKYKFDINIFDAVVQGDAAEDSIIDAMNRAYEYNCNYKPFDIIVIIRGGGSTSDLSCFDSYEVASMVAQFPIPILTGIGHDKDISVVDMVAKKSLKTPTAVAQFIINHAHNFETSLDSKYGSIIDSIQSTINTQQNILSNHINEILAVSSNLISETKLTIQHLTYKLNSSCDKIISNKYQILDNHVINLKNKVNLGLEYNKSKLTQNRIIMEQKLMIGVKNSMLNLELMGSNIEQFNPHRILKLGYCIISTENNSISSINNFSEGIPLNIVCNDGEITGNIINIKHKR